MKSKTIQVVSFDLFGTLVFYVAAWWKLFGAQALILEGIRPVEIREIAKRTIIDPRSIEEIFRDDLYIKSELLLRHLANNIQQETQSIQLYRDAADILIKLQQAGYKIAVMSNLAKDFWQPVQQLLPITPDFAILSFERGFRKPQPELFQELSCEADCDPEQILHIGNTIVNDCEGALNAGYKALLIDRSQQTKFGETSTINTLESLEYLLLL